MQGLFHFFAKRHMLANLVTLMLIVMGVTTLSTIKRDIYPHVEFGIMSIVTPYPGASPEDVELNVTNKIEKELKSVTGIDRVTSLSMENVSIISAFVKPDESDQEKIMAEIREAVNRVTNFPEEVTESPKLTELKQTNPAIEVGLSGDIPYRELKELARLFGKKLEDISGVSHLEKFGYRAREIKVEVIPQAIEKYQIPMGEITTAIMRRNIQATGGSMESYTSDKNVVTLAQFRNPQEVGDVIVRSTFDGPVIKVKDLAIIKDDFEDQRIISRMDGRTAISFAVYVSEIADVIRTTDAIKELIVQENKGMPSGVEIKYGSDTSRSIRNSFTVVMINGLLGLVFVVIILTLFLNTRIAFWVALGIPVSLLGVIFLLPLFGVYLDTILLTGMVLVIGIIVDDAIIIAENISRRRELGDEPLEAAVNGIKEVFNPVLTTILTTFLVFAPMFFMPGIFGKYLTVIPLAISLALFVSLFEVIVALPAHMVPGLKKKSAETTSREWFNVLKTGWEKIVYKILKRVWIRYILILLFITALIGSFWYAGNYMKFIMFPSERAETFWVSIELPIGTPLTTTSDRIREIEAIIAQIPEDELASYATRIGTNIFINAESENYAMMFVNLTPYANRSRSADEIVEDVRQKTDQLQGFENIIFAINTGGPGVGKPISIMLVGSNDSLRTGLADAVETFLAQTQGVKDINRNDKLGKEQVEVIINYEKLARLGLTVADVAQNVRIAYDGEVVTSVRYGDEDVDFRIMIQAEARRQLSYLEELRIPNRQGRLIPLKEVAVLKTGPGKADYRHYNNERTVTIEADIVQDEATPMDVIQQVLDHFNLDRDWPGLQILKGGEVMETEESMAGLLRTMMIGLVGIYFLLVLLFNSLTQPLLVMVAIPFGITGVIVTFALHGQPLTFTATMGIIGLIGVVVNDSLVMVNHINDLLRKKSGEAMAKIVALGTADRLRAIIMTTLTTVVGLLPLAYGFGGTDAFMAPMAMALGFGLLFATPLTLVLIPCLFMVGQDILGIFNFLKKIVKK
ncbi:MAG: efflux RND transporter permease subunit [Candidatus Neomarinimicrobiota bacterium]